MKRLSGVRLINWYHFVDETFRFDGSCLLLGDNGSGKSTVLDAIQLAVVANEAQVRFNKAANEHSRRSLYGYVRWKLGSEDETRPGQVRFGRGAATSYVMLRFEDSEDPTSSFSCGLCLEATEADTAVAKWPFVVVGATLDAIPAVDGEDRVRPMRDFRVSLREAAGYRPCPDLGTYREEVRHRLGLLPESFHRLIVKALDWKPIGQVRDFVFGFLLDERPVDTASLQANLEHYKRLEAEAQAAEKRIVELDNICEQGDRIAQERRTAESHRYLSLRASEDLAAVTLAGLEDALASSAVRKDALASEQVRIDEQIRFLTTERERIVGSLTQVPTFVQVRALEQDIERTSEALERSEKAESAARQTLESQNEALDYFLSEEARGLRRRRPALLDESDLVGSADAPAIVQRLRQTLSRTGALAGRDLRTWSERLEKGAHVLRRADAHLEVELDRLKAEGKELDKERSELDAGRQRYRDGVEALLHLLRTRLKSRRVPRPLCELIDVLNDRWRDAVEGFLNTRRFDIIVAAEDFPRALSLYENNKFGYPLPGRGHVDIANVGLVDIERIQASTPRPERRSLSEQVTSDDPLARVYLDYALGDVICVDSEQDLRKYRRAITDTVMVYQGHVARQTSPDVFRRHYIGQAARVRRLEEVGRRLAEISEALITVAGDVGFIERAVKAADRARREVGHLPMLVEEAERAPNLKAQLLLLKNQLSAIDRSELEALQSEVTAVDAKQEGLRTRDREIALELGSIRKEREQLELDIASAEEGIAVARRAREEMAAALAPDRRVAYEHRYERELVSRSASTIREVFERQQRNIESRIGTLIQTLVVLKTNYVNGYGFPGEVTGEDYEEFILERDTWKESHLPEYRARIGQAKEEAIQQLAEDIIFRLRENLVAVRRQLDELNRALHDVRFGTDRYQFTAEPSVERRDFYDLIMEAGRFEKDSLFGNAALTGGDTKRTLEDLFNRLVEGEARAVKSELEARADYREYFTYDLRIHHADKTFSSFDRVAADKSGGETQTPYYVAIFASMYRLYRSHALAGGKPTCGLLLLDEAFSKMDEGRIAATLAFARNLDLQLLLATPKERSELVAPYVETSLYIHKDALSGQPTVLDFTKEFAAPSSDDAGESETKPALVLNNVVSPSTAKGERAGNAE